MARASRGATRRRERVSTGRDEYLLRRGRVVTALSLPGRLNPRATPSGRDTQPKPAESVRSVSESPFRLEPRSRPSAVRFRSYSACVPRIPVNNKLDTGRSLNLLRQLYYESVYVITAS